jgi:hypothetical protein
MPSLAIGELLATPTGVSTIGGRESRKFRKDSEIFFGLHVVSPEIALSAARGET